MTAPALFFLKLNLADGNYCAKVGCPKTNYNNRIAPCMTRFFPFALLFIFAGCQNGNTPSTDPKENRYYSIYNQIYSQWGKIALDSTQQKLEVYLQEFPENADAQMLAGNVAYALKQDQKAINYYRNAINYYPSRAIYYSALGSVFSSLNQIDSAEKYLQKAISLNDSSAYTFLNASLLYLKKKEREKSLAFADTAFAAGNSSPIICSGLSFVFKGWNDEVRSREFYTRAVDLGLKDTLALQQLLAGEIKPEDYYRTHH